MERVKDIKAIDNEIKVQQRKISDNEIKITCTHCEHESPIYHRIIHEKDSFRSGIYDCNFFFFLYTYLH